VHVEQLTAAQYRPMPWQNGLGSTLEIARHPASGEASLNFDWRLSLATIDRDAEFSRFPGYDRSLLLLNGDGIRIALGDQPWLDLGPRADALSFPGDLSARDRTIAGSATALNLISRRNTCQHRLLRRPLVGPMVLLPEPRVRWLIHMVSGWARRQHAADAETLASGDTLIVEVPKGERPLVLVGSGEVVLARIEARLAASAGER